MKRVAVLTAVTRTSAPLIRRRGGLDLLACARRAASMVVPALTVAYAEGLREHKVRRSAASSRETFLRIMERSFSGIAIMLKDTPYA
ncbi:hypothetical protein [Bradyrhizobium elkanii]|uniref:hypothetical protein n=1 Tax=Bradyrhizobium elkanii TaxID=29448 RepID=UPI00384FE375